MCFGISVKLELDMPELGVYLGYVFVVVFFVNPPCLVEGNLRLGVVARFQVSARNVFLRARHAQRVAQFFH